MNRDRVLSNRQVLRATLVVLLGFLASGVLGFIRLWIVNRQFGTGAALDSFYAAQRIPEFIFMLVAGGALGSSFIPVYAKLREADQSKAWQLASAVMTLSALAAGVMGAVIALFAPWIVENILRVSDPAQIELTANMIRIMMVTPFIFAISGLVMGLLQSHQLFLFPSIALSMNNIGIMIGALVIAPLLPPDQGIGQVGNFNIYGLAIGAVLSAVLHLLVQLPGLRQIHAQLRVQINWRIEGVVEVIQLMIPRILGQSVVQINFLVNVILTAPMVDGSLVALTTAFQLTFFVLGIIGQSVGSAVFPSLAAAFAEEDMTTYKDRLSTAMRNVLYLSLPATVALIVLGVPLVSVFELGGGEWNSESTTATAWALAFYALGIPGFSILELLSRAFYALHDTWTPVLIGIGAIIANIVLSIVLINVIGDPDSLTRGAFAGLALANSSTTLAEAGILWWLLRRRIGDQGTIAGINDRYIWQGVLMTAVATVFFALTTVVSTQLLQQIQVTGLFNAIISMIAGGIVFFGMSAALRMQEARMVLSIITRRGS